MGFSLSATGFPPGGARTEEALDHAIVYHRRKDVHEEDREHHPFGIGRIHRTDEDAESADPKAVDPLSILCRGGGYWIGRHIDRAEEEPTQEDMPYGGEMHDAGGLGAGGAATAGNPKLDAEVDQNHHGTDAAAMPDFFGRVRALMHRADGTRRPLFAFSLESRAYALRVWL